MTKLKSSIVGLFVLTLAASVQAEITKEEATTIARLYTAAFDRPPKDDGLNFWIDSYKSGRSIPSISGDLANSAEFVTKYGNLRDDDFVRQLYRNVLGREGKSGGIAFWLGKLERDSSRGYVLARFGESPENIANTKEIFAGISLGPHGGWTLTPAGNSPSAIPSGSAKLEIRNTGGPYVLDATGKRIGTFAGERAAEFMVDVNFEGFPKTYRLVLSNVLVGQRKIEAITVGYLLFSENSCDSRGAVYTPVEGKTLPSDISMGSRNETYIVDPSIGVLTPRNINSVWNGLNYNCEAGYDDPSRVNSGKYLQMRRTNLTLRTPLRIEWNQAAVAG